MAPRALRHKQRNYYFCILQSRNDCGHSGFAFSMGMRAHPTYNEAVGEALEELEGGSIHTVPRQAPGKLKSRQ